MVDFGHAVEAHIAGWRCHLCENEFSVERGGCCRSCGRPTCNDCWGDRSAFLPTRQMQRQCKECVAGDKEDPEVAAR